MDYEKADQIIGTFNKIPTTREDQQKLIRIVGYNRIKTSQGLSRLENCPDRQIQAVARDYHRRAEQTINAYWREIDLQDYSNYLDFLCDLFNLPEDLRDQADMKELEEQLMG